MRLQAAAIFGYVVLQLAIGYFVSRRVSTQADYLVAGRRLGYRLGIFTVFATWFGAESCISSAASAATEGVSLISVEPFGYGAGVIVMGLVVAAPLWKRGLITLVDLFRVRYSPGVERLAALLLVPGSVLWAAAQVKAFGQVLAVPTGLDLVTATAVAAGVVMVYTGLGGLLADAVSDFVQGIILVGCLLAMGFLVFDALGGGEEAWSRAREFRKLSVLGGGDAGFLHVLESWALPICGSLVAPELAARVNGMRSAAVARRATVIGGILYTAVGLIPVTLGLLCAHEGASLDDARVDSFLPGLAERYLPGALYVLFSGALVSAILSTVDSALLAAGSLTSQNLLLSISPERSDRWKLIAARTCVVVFGIIALVLALKTQRISHLIEEASGFATGGICVTLVFALFTPFGGSWSAYAALIAGVGSWIAGRHWLDAQHPYLTSIAAALIAYVAAACAQRLAARSAVSRGPAAPESAEPSSA